MAELVTPINKTSNDLATARKRTVEVMAKLGNLKSTFAATSIAGGGPPNLRAEISKMKENVVKFKELLVEASIKYSGIEGRLIRVPERVRGERGGKKLHFQPI